MYRHTTNTVSWISPMRYGYALLLANQFEGWDAPGAQEYYVDTSVSTGLSNYVNVLILVGLFFGALVGAYLALVRVVMKNEGRGRGRLHLPLRPLRFRMC